MLSKTSLAFFFFLLPAQMLFAQSSTYPVDSSYTVAGSYKKLAQDYPDIHIAEGVPENHIRIKTGLVYKTVGDRELHLDIYGPDSSQEGPFPAILMIHGGGWSSGNRSHMEMMARDLAFNGYVAIPVEYRLSPEASYPAGIEDLQDAVRWIVENGAPYRADRQHIVTLGASAGAHLATLLGTTENDLLPFKGNKSNVIRGIINIDGIVSFVHPEAKKEGNAASRWLGGHRNTHWSNWMEASPLAYVDADSPPILFVNGSFPRFHAGRDSLCTRYADYGIHYDIFEFSDAPHTFWFFHPWYTPMMYTILRFLQNLP